MTALEGTIVVTGGAGFIGSNFIHHWIRTRTTGIVTLDKLTYAGNLNNFRSLGDDSRHTFVRADINDRPVTREVFARFRPSVIVHFAAESHVDRSILGPEEFIRTNINGTFALLEETRSYWNQLSVSDRKHFRFLHVSTDEVYGTLSSSDVPFHENTPYAPNSPYAASKAASDHLVRAYHETYGLPTLTTNCSNNYGPFQFPEKLIPLMILNAVSGNALPIYGDGLNVRDWLYVVDHCEAICSVLARGKVGETYNIGGWNEMTNLNVVRTLCALLDEFRPNLSAPYTSLITFVKDRPGHDRRYAIDASKIERELGWRPKETFESGIRKTVQWYLANMRWVEEVQSGSYQQWIDTNYKKRESLCEA